MLLLAIGCLSHVSSFLFSLNSTATVHFSVLIPWVLALLLYPLSYIFEFPFSLPPSSLRLRMEEDEICAWKYDRCEHETNPLYTYNSNKILEESRLVLCCFTHALTCCVNPSISTASFFPAMFPHWGHVFFMASRSQKGFQIIRSPDLSFDNWQAGMAYIPVHGCARVLVHIYGCASEHASSK